MEQDVEEIGRFRFDAAGGTVTPAQGPSIALRQQTAAVLRVLCNQRGKIVSRDDLMAEVWPTTTVTEDSVTQCIREIRAALDSDGHRLIRTFPKRGYMLEPASESSNLAAPPIQRRAIPLALLAICSLALIFMFWPRAHINGDRPKIVVQAFQDVYQTEKWSRIGAGLASELSASLARNEWLEVRQVGQAPDGARKDGYVLSGTISAAHDTIRLTAKLVDGKIGDILWSEVWSGPVESVFDIQSNLLEKVEATIVPGWTGVIALDRMEKATAPPNNLGAFDLYLRAIEQKHLFTKEALVRSQRYLEQALELDPDYARAWTALAIVHLLQMEGAKTVEAFESHLQRRVTATERALQLSPNDPETLIQATFLYGRLHDHAAAEAALRSAAELGWNNPDILAQAAWGGARRVPVGADAIIWARRAFELNPKPPPWYYAALATAAFYAESFEMAEDAYSKAPPMTEILYRRAARSVALGDLEKATNLLAQAKGQLPDGLTITALEAADGNTFPPYVSLLTELLNRVDPD
ncbi:winged helix-turn-helix domain-containing protein [Sedimentitalea sp.]|uniref:winged helix-turn-helix domain-containing protein n=1 Tax=Sedimentitalea sp. TaxID=2048915 RepID=UPI00329706A5